MATDTFCGWLLALKTFIGHFAVSLEMRYQFFYVSECVFCVACLLFVRFFFFFLHLVNKFELLLLIVLGGVPIRGIRFTAPGAMHQARWMSKVIYSMKVWLFRSQFKLTTKELKSITEVVIFCILVYLKTWMTPPLAISAPRNDLNLLKTLIKYEQVNPKVSKAAATKMLITCGSYQKIW